MKNFKEYLKIVQEDIDIIDNKKGDEKIDQIIVSNPGGRGSETFLKVKLPVSEAIIGKIFEMIKHLIPKEVDKTSYKISISKFLQANEGKRISLTPSKLFSHIDLNRKS